MSDNNKNIIKQNRLAESTIRPLTSYQNGNTLFVEYGKLPEDMKPAFIVRKNKNSIRFLPIMTLKEAQSIAKHGVNKSTDKIVTEFFL